MNCRCMGLTLLVLALYASMMACHAEENSTLLIGIYTSGGSLEQEAGLITGDLTQVMNGSANLSPERTAVLVAYGGADKPGWRGMTIASPDDLKTDLSDGELGNQNISQEYLPGANMGDPETVSYFLSFIRENYQYERFFLIFTGHGEAYTGMLFDQNHGSDGLTIEELTMSLKQASMDIELIGFDSCLMSGLEVASALSPFAEYLIASEESEPAEGWQYESWISYLADHPDAPAQEHADILFDSYMQNPWQGKTIALLNIRETGFLTSELDSFGKNLYALSRSSDGRESIQRALSNTQQFGRTGSGMLEEATMDLYSFADAVATEVPYLTESAEMVKEGVDRVVISARHDDLVPGAHGISVLSPVLIGPAFYHYYHGSAFITPGWDRFLTCFLSNSTGGTGE